MTNEADEGLAASNVRLTGAVNRRARLIARIRRLPLQAGLAWRIPG